MNGFSGKVDVTVVVGYEDHIPDKREAILEENKVTVCHAKKMARPTKGSKNDQSADKKIVEILERPICR
ncbi:unnamed protein product [Arabis nemorensis]|uniref:Uncharacterized protein n=1 Tax=Arabis nemorensis TaxID=586526 RepID=A0A565C7U1_9BRAS|nr:unnamed protein product [Arabis nemorensis]